MHDRCRESWARVLRRAWPGERNAQPSASPCTNIMLHDAAPRCQFERMATPSRLQLPSALYHITSRGNRREAASRPISVSCGASALRTGSRRIHSPQFPSSTRRPWTVQKTTPSGGQSST